jgi:hypothetical protein
MKADVAANASPAPETPAQERPPTFEEIAHSAYFLWEQQGCPEGCDLANWLQAEAELKEGRSPENVPG